MADKYHDTVAKSTVTTDDAAVAAAVKKILDENLADSHTPDNLKLLLGCIDLTTLRSTDSPNSIMKFVERVNDFENEHGDLPCVAAVCTWPNLVATARTVLEVSEVNIAAVAGGFPSAQTFPEVKMAETALAAEGGADEVDVVMNLGYFLDDDWEQVSDELEEMSHSCRGARMKVILETGALVTAEKIRAASVLALYSGADFLKTSTGKEWPGATVEAAYVMCSCIREYFKATGRKVGFKAAGGITTAEQALAYYCIVKAVLGEEWLTPEYFRIGASRLANNLLSEILGEETRFF